MLFQQIHLEGLGHPSGLVGSSSVLGMMHGGGGGPWMMVLPFVLLAALVFGAIYLVRALWPESRTGVGPASERDAAMEALRERFARGEIDQDEFDRRRQALRR